MPLRNTDAQKKDDDIFEENTFEPDQVTETTAQNVTQHNMDPISSHNSVDQIQQKPLVANQISTHENATTCNTIDNNLNENSTPDSDNQVNEPTTRVTQHNSTDADIPSERDANNHSVNDQQIIQ